MKRNLFFVSTVLMAITTSSHSQGPTIKEPPPIGVAHQFDWLSEEWTGNERPYRKIRNDIERSLSQGQTPEVLLKKYSSRASKAPSDPLAQYGRLYLIYTGAVAHSKVAEHQLYLLPPVYRGIHSPHTYEFARVHFLNSAYGTPDPKLKDIGLRLLRRDPKDERVKFHMIDIFNTTEPKERRLALEFAQDRVRAHANQAKPYTSLGWVHMRIWLDTHDEVERKLAIDNYNKYLQLASPKDDFRQQAHNLLRILQPTQNHSSR